MGNGIQITGLSSSFDLSASNFADDASAYMHMGKSVSRATAALPATTTANIFTVAGGRILLRGILGEVTTVIQTQACNLSIVVDPTVAGTNVALCAVLNVSAHAVGTLYTMTGTASDALAFGLAVKGMVTPWIVPPGGIALVTSATNTGSVSWKLWYVPLDANVVVAAV